MKLEYIIEKLEWEYKVEQIYRVSTYPDRAEKDLNKLGLKGWELVCIDQGNFATFKRIKR